MNVPPTALLGMILFTGTLLAPGLGGAEGDGESREDLERHVRELDQKLKALEARLELEKGAGAEQAKGPSGSKAEQPAGGNAREAAGAEEKSKGPRSIFELPEWIKNIKLVNDFRARYDGIYAPDSDFVTRNRARFRLRLGAIITIQDDFNVGVRLASAPSTGGDSGGDPVSTNATLENDASRKPVGIDWAFVKWSPIHTERLKGSFTFGKMENPPNYSEMIFDVDYTPEGLSEQFSYEMNRNHALNGYFGQYAIDELQFSARDPYLFLEQLRLDSILTDRITTSIGGSGLIIVNASSLTTASVPDSNHGNTRDATGALVNKYHLAIADAGLTYNLDRFPLYQGRFPIKVSGEYIHNFGADDSNIAYAFGPTFGRSGKKGNWEVSYRYQELQADANYEELTASDYGAFYRGRPAGEPATLRVPTFLNGTNIRGHIFKLSYSPFDSLTIYGNVWLTEAINEVPRDDPIKGVRVIIDAV